MKKTTFTLRATFFAATSLAGLAAIPATAQDLVVDGSLCVGFDCPANPSFGSDTIRLQENNLRIHFDDTSTAGSFPSNDWAIQANDQANGGASYLAIVDRTAGRTVFSVAANARSNALVVDSQGDVGIGTANATTTIHAVDGDTPTLRLAQDTSSGFAAQTWDLAGNETSFFIRDSSNGSTLPFRIRPGAASNSLVIDTDNDVGIGTLTSEASLHVKRTGSNEATVLIESVTGDSSFVIEQAGTTSAAWEFRNQADSGRLNVGLVGGNTPLKIDNGADNNLLKLGTNANSSAVVVTGELLVNNITMNVPDYVFEPGYALPSLHEVEAFIHQNGHLPGVPSAKKVASDGALNMTEMQMAQLEKIEELTLHSIAQQKTIEAQETALTAQQDRISRLEAVVQSIADQ
ncbi:hypothetical protein A8B82_12070 [Sulfitobacter sp. EhC04]|uniref:hypothetical protein n=1 Tax=Sulfitobacter sp. EhC04 TaxID=1849168 RepID=UPI0007F3C81D|nr:hypothetical protein [Sulfitobacter sp. EhC04]OAN77645.1 hypothetical protein A8B82_12070 [Sulfitobacter sp. EhC04]